MDPELKDYLDRRFEAIDRRINDLEQRMEQRFLETDQKIERVETNLLTAFHKWASPMEARMRSHNAALRAFDEELESFNDRVKKLEDNAA